MAKKRSASAKEKLGKTPSVSRSCVSSKPNGVSQRSSRSPPKTTTRSTKRDLKSTRVLSAKESPANRRGCKEERTKRGPCSGKRRHSSHEEPNESLSKKPKIESLQVQKEETTHSQTKDCSLQGNRKKAGKSKQLLRKGQNQETITTQTNLKQALTVEENYSKQKSPLKNIYEATPENLQGSPGKDKVLGKRLKLDLVTNVGEDVAAKNDAEGSSCDESSDEENVAWEDVDEAHVADHRLEIADHETEASASHQQPSPSKKIVEISLTVPGAKKKKGWNQEDFMKYVKRAINRFRKEVFINVHKVHLLALVAQGMFRNSVCNDPLLQAVLLSHVPNDFVSGNKRKWDVAQLTNFLKWFQSEFTSTDDGRTGETEADKQVSKLQNLTEVFIIILRALGFLTRLVYSLQPMSAKGDLHGKSSPKSSNKKTLQGTKPAVKKSSSKESSKTSTLPKKQRTAEKKEIKTENEVTQPSSTCKSVSSRSGNKSGSGKQNEGQVEKCLKKNSRKTSKGNGTVKASKRKSQVDRVSVEDMEDASSGKKNTCKTKSRPLRKRKRVDYSLSGSNNESDADKEWNDQSSDSEESSDENRLPKENSKLKEKTPLARRKKSTASDSSSPSGNSSLSFVDLMDDDSDFEVTSKPLVRRQASAGSSEGKRKVVKIVSSDESDESVKCLGYVSNEQGVNWWAEVYLPVDKKWICVHLESSSINHPDLCEKQATQPLVYVVAFDNKNSIKDVTNRYASSWMSKTRKLRIDSDWWEDTLRPYKSKNKKMMEMEDSHLEDQLLDKPLPTSITEYKNHPLYVLKRHLLKFEAIYPETAAILGYCRNEAVYSRECVHTLHTREKWLNEALVVKQGEKAYKVVKGRPKRNQPIHERDSVTIDLFGRWQTEKYKPPPAKDGKVPRNEYGNVELFLPCMLPPGTKHIQINGIHRVAKKLGIDSAQAVVGFDFHGGFSHPVIDGVVVCEEFEQALLDAWKEEEEQAAKRKAEKREKRMLANWRLLTRSLLIRERLKKRYDTEETNVAETSNDGEDEMITGTSICWPLNRQEGKSSVASDGHCHVFPESGHKQDSVTGEWTKSCSCGLTLPFEKM